MPAAKLNATVTHRQKIHSRLIILRVAPDGWTLPEFSPGQYVTIGIPGSAPRIEGSDAEEQPPKAEKLILRAYSITSSSRAREYIELYVNLVDSGTFTPRLFALQVGDRLWLKPKIKGMFTLDDVPADKHILMIATGTGLAPYMSMLRSHPECSGERRYAVLLGARHVRDLGYHDELEELARRCSNVSYLPIISRPQEEERPWSGAVGHVQDLWRDGQLEHLWGFRPTPGDTHAFLCGSPAMIEDMVAILEAEGFRRHFRREPGQIHTEEYW